MNNPTKPDGIRTDPTGGVKTDRDLSELTPSVPLDGGVEAANACTQQSAALTDVGSATMQLGAGCEGGTSATQGDGPKVDRGL